MTMRKKDYEAIARAIAHVRGDCTFANNAATVAANMALDDTAERIAYECGSTNPTFKRERFLADCGVSHD